MKVIIDTDKCAELGLTPDVALYLASLYFEHTITKETFNEVCKKGYITYESFVAGFPVNGKITQDGVDVIESLFLNSEIVEVSKDSGGDRFMVLADKLRELFPQGRKQGTNLQWKDSTVMISKRLKTLIKKYGVSFTDEEAVEATKRYVESYRGDYRFMQVLRYFLWKDDKITGEETSQFLSYLQNKGSDTAESDWTTRLR